LAKKGIHLNRIISMLQQGMGDFSELCAKAYAQLSEEARVVLNLICISRESISGEALQTVLENLHHISRQTVEEDLLQQIRDLGLIEEHYVLRWTNSRFFPASRLVREYYNGTIKALRPEEDHRLRNVLATYYKEQCELKGRENWSEHNWLEQNLKEIFATIEWYDHTQQGSSLVQIIKHIYYFLGVRGYWRERLMYGDRAGQAARELDDFQSEAEILVRVIGYIEIQLGEYVKAEEDILRGLRKFEELNDNGGIASAYRYLGSLERRRNNYDRAEDYYEEAISHAQLASDSERLIAGIKISLSTMHFKRQQIKECEQQLQEALDIFERLDHISKVTELKSRLADVKFRQGQYEEARKLYLESEEDAKRIWRKKTRGYNYLGLARIAQVQGEHTVAADYACKARELFGNLGLADEGSEVADLFDLCRQ
jgi:tetratricopeptide (TPR) repeat protein